MKNAAAFRACYSDFKLVKTRGVVQLVFEVPLSEADAAYQVVGGMPDPGADRWFAIARLNTGADSDPLPPVAPVREADVSGPPSASRPIAPEKRLTRQAAICCADPVFRLFLAHIHCGNNVIDEPKATAFVRDYCNVVTRKDIIPGTDAGDRWIDLHGQFEAWKLVPA